MIPRSLRVGLFWLLVLLITGFSLYPQPPGPELEGADKVRHLLAYLILFISCDLAYWPRQRLAGKLLLLLAFSFLIEVAQNFVPTRYCTLGDLVANLVGLFLGLMMAGPTGRFLNTRNWLS